MPVSMPISAGDMVDRDIGDSIRRHRARRRAAVGPEEAARGAQPPRDLGRGRGRGDPRLPGGDPGGATQALIRAAAGGRKVSRWISWMRGQVSWTGRPQLHRDDRRLLDRALSSLRP